MGLSTCATLLLADNVNPVALIYVGPPSAGKTTVASMFDGAKVKGELLCYRSDKFTPAAFVSHSAKANKSQLENIDLLPRIRYKVLLTPEMSTMFQGKADELRERFTIITRVLDGQGLKTDSGTHGSRGYEGDYLFAWLGCTTPFQPNVWKVMAQLGSRLFFLLMDAVAEPTIDDLVSAINQEVPYKQRLDECKQVVHQYLGSLFGHYFTHKAVHPDKAVRRVPWKPEGSPRDVLEGIARCATLLATLRTHWDRTEDTPPQPESPHRANAVLYNLARGRALVYGRTELAMDDLTMIAQVTLSSIPAERQAVLVALAKNDEEPLTVRQVEEATGVTRHTAENLMKDLDRLGVMTFEKDGDGKPSHLSIRPEWSWCMAKDFAPLLLGTATWQKSGGESLVATD